MLKALPNSFPLALGLLMLAGLISRIGALDAGSVGDTPPIHAAFTGLDIKIIAVHLRDKASMHLALAPGLELATLGELRGKRIAYAPGQAQGALVLRVLERAKLATRDVKLVELTMSAAQL